MTSLRGWEPASFWRQSAPSIVGGDALPPRSEIVVAGAGLAGLAAALELVRAGREVVVIEADELGGRTTSRTTGKVSLLQGATASQIRVHAGDGVLASYLEANAAGADWMRRELASVPAAWEDRTAWTYALTDEGLGVLSEEADAMDAAGHPAERTGPLPPDETGLPLAIGGALRLPGQAQVQPVVAAAALVDRIRSAGGRLVDRCRMTGAHAKADRVEIETDRGAIVADRLVVATGTPVLDRALLFAALTPQRQAVAAFRLPDDSPPPAGMYLSVDPVGRSVRSARDRDGAPVVIVGGGTIETGREDAVGDLRDAIADWTAEHYPGAAPLSWWAAQDYRMATRVPYAGAVRGGHDRIHAMTGFAKWGMTNAPAAALAVIGEIMGEVPQWHTKLREHRAGLRDVGETVAHNAKTGAQLVQGWVAPGTSSTSDRAEVVRDGIHPVAQSEVDGVVCKVSAVCTHLGGIVRWNDAEATWDCPLHGSRFTREGHVIEGPATADLATP